jgi:hypothetical protein
MLFGNIEWSLLSELGSLWHLVPSSDFKEAERYDLWKYEDKNQLNPPSSSDTQFNFPGDSQR